MNRVTWGGCVYKRRQMRPVQGERLRDANGAIALLEEAPEPSADIRLSVVVPTRNEAGNVAPLVERLEDTFRDDLDGVEIIFVDDSSDDTPDAVAAASEASPLTIRLIHRTPDERVGGLGGAVLAGFSASQAPWLCVMDGDLQHPPELIRELREQATQSDADIVVASRYATQKETDGLSWSRSLVSRALTSATRLAFPRRLRGNSDPLSGFFLVRRDAVALDKLRPRGFKIQLEILARSKPMRTAEVPFEFGNRHAGESKAGLREGLTYLSQLARLRVGGRPVLFTKFAAVGATGIVVNMALFAGLIALDIQYLVAALIATQGSTIWLFLLTDRWVFRHRSFRRGTTKRVVLYFVLNNLSFVARGLLLFGLVSGIGLNALIANFISLVSLTLARFFIADGWIWQPRGAGQDRFDYDVHGIVTVTSEVALPELARFSVAELDGPPDVDVSVGQLADTAEDTAADLTLTTRRIEYDDGLGRIGFAVQIRKGRTTEIAASRLVGASPHVLYTNIVEPVLRWRIVDRGYALVHAACVAFDGKAVFVTARTDTGKTTTILKALDNFPCDFISDDLTLLTPDGKVLTYPKPLTVSKHTVGAVKTPNLTRTQRLGLPLQSRIHSKSGRSFAFILAKLRLPVASINATLQIIVPPPKYHVEKLVPSVNCVEEATLAGVVVIERADKDEELELAGQEITDLLISNTEDAYGFPPYPTIASSLHGTGSSDLHHAEREIISSAVERLPASILRRQQRDWWQYLPTMVAELRLVTDEDKKQHVSDPSQDVTVPEQPHLRRAAGTNAEVHFGEASRKVSD